MNFIIGTKEQCEFYNAYVTELKNYNGVTTKWADAKKHPTQDVWSIVEEPSVPVFNAGELLIDKLAGVTVVAQLPDDWAPKEDELI